MHSCRGPRPHPSAGPALGRLGVVAAVTVLLCGGAAGCARSVTAAPAGGPASAGPAASPSTSPGQPPPGQGHHAAVGAPVKPGNIWQTVKPGTVRTARPVGIGAQDRSAGHRAATSSFGDKVTASLTDIRHRWVAAQIPGQLPGPSVIFDLTIRNDSYSAVDLNALVVNLTDAGGSTAESITGSSPARSLPAELRPGRSATGTFVFVVAKTRRDPITVDVTINAHYRVVTFRGNAR